MLWLLSHLYHSGKETQPLYTTTEPCGHLTRLDYERTERPVFSYYSDILSHKIERVSEFRKKFQPCYFYLLLK